MQNTKPLEPVTGSWDVEITKMPGRDYSAREQDAIDRLARDMSEMVNDEDGQPDEIGMISVITFRKIL